MNIYAGGKSVRILLDTRKYIKNNPEVHDRLAKLSREIFLNEMGNAVKCFAVLNSKYDYENSDREKWFTNKQKAIDWLLTFS